jgi:hypothetical protein
MIARHLLKLPGASRLLSRMPSLPVSLRVEYDLWPDPAYGYGLQSGARLAKVLGVPRITAMEWGIVQGDRTVQMERIAPQVSAHFGVDIAVAAFDTGRGLPPPVDFRDCPHVWAEGFYTTDIERVRGRVSTTQLCFGDVGSGIAGYLAEADAAPVGFVACNLDYYSLASTALDALASAPQEKRLPRILMLFDDLVFPERACHNEWTGELRAINEFNASHEYMKVAPLRWLEWMRHTRGPWHQMVYVLHDFSHPQYNVLVTPEGYRHRQM